MNLNSILLFTILVIFSSVFSGMYIEIYATFDSRVRKLIMSALEQSN